MTPRPSPARPARLLPIMLALAGATAAAGCAAQAQPPAYAQPVETPRYAALADLAIAAPIVADATIRSATRIKGAEAASVPAGQARFYVEADIAALLRAPAALPPRIGYLVDVPTDARGRAPSLKKRRVLVFARAVPGNAAQLQLVTPGAQLDWTPQADATVRAIVRDLVAGDAPPVITGVGNAFHVPGSLPGESETQIFLTTADNRPVSLSVLRRPGEQPRWAVALSEIVDDAAGPPARDTLLWYRLACALPPALPERSTASLDADGATAAREDYAFVLAALGACERGANQP